MCHKHNAIQWHYFGPTLLPPLTHGVRGIERRHVFKRNTASKTICTFQAESPSADLSQDSVWFCSLTSHEKSIPTHTISTHKKIIVLKLVLNN